MLRTGGTETGALFSLLDLESGKVVGFDAGLSQMLAQYVLGEPSIRIATVLTLLAIAAVVSVAIDRFAGAGQLTAAKWDVFTLPYVRSFVWSGLLNTLKLTVVSGLIALPLGALFALLRLAHNKALRWLRTACVEVFRAGAKALPKGQLEASLAVGLT